MPDSRVYLILEAIQGKVAADFSAKSSAIDLRSRIVLGAISEPPYVPSGCVNFIEYATSHGPTLGRYSMAPRFEVYLFIGGGSVADRLKNAINLCSDVIENLTADRFLGLGGGTIDDVLCQFTALDGNNYGLDGIGIGYIEVNTPFQSATGI